MDQEELLKRLNKYQIAHNTASWAKEQLRILNDMVSDRVADETIPPLSMRWLSNELKRIRDGIEIVG